MNEATIALTVMTGLLLVSFLGFLVWGIRSGQFKNIEDAKYRIFDDRGDDPPSDSTPPVSGPAGGEGR
jgi:cbb3-type cytochrome oxidase maturation protein